MRNRGLTLLEIMIVTTILAGLLIGAFGLLDFGNTTFSKASVKQLTQRQAQRVLDKIAEDFSCCAAWQIFDVPLADGIHTGGAATRLTKFYTGKKLTGGYASGNNRVACTFPAKNAETDGVAFLRIVGATALSATSGYGAYLIHDFEPKQATGTVFTDVSADGAKTTASFGNSNHQGGRVNDDPNRQYIYYRTRVANRRVLVERVRGVPATAISTDGYDNPVDGAATAAQKAGLNTTASLVELVGDLGPADTVGTHGGTLPSGTTQGAVLIDMIDVNNTSSGAGEIHIKVTAKGLVRKGPSTEVVIGEAETIVAIQASLSPY